jgi:hypothetical protein
VLGVWSSPARTNLRCSKAPRGLEPSYSPDRNPGEAWLNLLAINFFSQPLRLIARIPGLYFGGTAALLFGLACAGLRTVACHSAKLCHLDEPLSGNSDAAQRAIPATQRDRRSATPTNSRRTGGRFGGQIHRAVFSLTPMNLGEPCCLGKPASGEFQERRGTRNRRQQQTSQDGVHGEVTTQHSRLATHRGLGMKSPPSGKHLRQHEAHGHQPLPANGTPSSSPNSSLPHWPPASGWLDEWGSAKRDHPVLLAFLSPGRRRNPEGLEFE